MKVDDSMNKKFRVKFRGSEIVEFEEGTTFKQISEHFKHNYNYDILVAKVNNNITDLSDTLKKKCEVDFYDRSSSVGNGVYRRSARFILILAVKNVLGSDAEIFVKHSIDKGTYFTVENKKINKGIVNDIYNEMKDIVKKDYIFTKLSVSRLDAIKYFKKDNKFDKVNVLKYISNTYINLYRINDIYDYFYDKMAYSTGQITDFKLTYIPDAGIVLSIPDTNNPEIVYDYEHHEKIFNEFSNYIKWGKSLGIENAADLNRIVSQNKISELIRVAEAHYNSQLNNKLKQ